MVKNQRSADSIRDHLKREGIQVLDVHAPIGNNYSLGNEWDLRMDHDQVSDLVDNAVGLDYYMHKSGDQENEITSMDRSLKEYRRHHTELQEVLSANPEIKDQWDEMMVMMKMAGLDTSLIRY